MATDLQNSNDDRSLPAAKPAVFEAPENEAAARRWRAYQRDRTARLEAYTEAAKTLLAARGFPVHGGGDITLAASHQQNLDPTIQRACKHTLLAILADMARIAQVAASDDEQVITPGPDSPRQLTRQ